MTAEEVAALFGEVLEQIRNYYDWCDGPEHEDRGCMCAGCQAKYALDQVGNWRMELAKKQAGVEDVEPVDTDQRGHGSTLPDRLAWHARERRLVGSFLGEMPRLYFARIIDLVPTVRDWSVALSVMRWIGTNVGSAVLETAGWRYDRYKEDRELDVPFGVSVGKEERWAQGIGWVVGVAESTLATKDQRLQQLAREALVSVRAVYEHLNLRSERKARADAD